jgi:hypothetical protein
VARGLNQTAGIMQIVYRELYDWEWGDVTLHAREVLSNEVISRLPHFLDNWVKTRCRETTYSHVVPRINLDDVGDHKRLGLRMEWVPKEWFEPLAIALEKEFPSLQIFEIGEDFTPHDYDEDTFIEVPANLVEFEDQSTVFVNSFEIAKYPVSISRMAQFCETTGYETVAEKRKNEDTFRDNQCVSDVPVAKRGGLPAVFVCYSDAMAYCKWAEVRLPTEAEWLAASLIEKEPCAPRDENDLRSQLKLRREALELSFEEITGTVLDNKRVVLRSGPYLVRRQKPEPLRALRRTVGFFAYGDPVEFRVCKVRWSK